MNKQKKSGSNLQQSVPFFAVSDMNSSMHFYVDGLGFEITHKWVEKTGKSEDSVRRYIRLARELIANRPQESTRELINKHIAIREDIYRKAEHSRDKLQAVESIAKLQGLDVKRIEVVNKTLNDIEDTVILEALTEADGE